MRELRECKKCKHFEKVVGNPGTILSYVYCGYGGKNYSASHKKLITKTLKVIGCVTDWKK